MAAELTTWTLADPTTTWTDVVPTSPSGKTLHDVTDALAKLAGVEGVWSGRFVEDPARAVVVVLTQLAGVSEAVRGSS